MIEQKKEGKTYEIIGSYDEEGNIAVLIFGHNENLTSNEDFKGKNGFMITNITADKRLLDSREIDEIWLPSFVKQVRALIDDVKYDKDGEIERTPNGVAKFQNTYDYIWFSLQKTKEYY